MYLYPIYTHIYIYCNLLLYSVSIIIRFFVHFSINSLTCNKYSVKTYNWRVAFHYHSLSETEVNVLLIAI